MNISKKKNFESFFNDYILTLESKLKDIQLDKLFIASELILKTIKKKKIYLCLWKWRIWSNCRPLYL